jgi:hypothetical protein
MKIAIAALTKPKSESMKKNDVKHLNLVYKIYSVFKAQRRSSSAPVK